MRNFTVLLMVAACGGGPKPATPTVPAPPPPPGEPAAAPPAEPAPPPMAEGHPKDGLIPRSVLFGNPEKTALKISPDGAWYSWLAPTDGVLNVWVAPASDVTKARSLTDEKTRPIRSYFYDPIPQLLANRGYAAISVNYRGSTGFGKNFVNAGDKQWGEKMHDDVLDVVQWAIDQGIAPKDKIAIIGGSYGGYETLIGITKTPDVFACGVELCGPSDLVTFQETIPPYWGPAIPMFHARIGDPSKEEDKKLLREGSPLTYVGQITKPLLIGQGKNDPRVAERESAQIVKAMQEKHMPVSYLLFPDEGHGLARPENNIAFFGVMEAFLSVHLGGYFQPMTKEELAASSMQIEAGKQWLPGLLR